MDGKRRIQPATTREEDIAAALAEAYVAQWLGCEFNTADGADKGWDLEYEGYRIDVKWIKPNSKARNLLVKAQRGKNGSAVWAPRFPVTDIYVLVDGVPGAFEIVGWAWTPYVMEHGERHDRPQRVGDLPYFLVRREDLLSPDLLTMLGQTT